MLMSAGSIEIESDVLTFLIELKARRARQTLRERELIRELMRKLSSRKHRFRVNASCLRKSVIEREGRCAGLRSGLIRQIEQHLFSGGIVVAEWNVGSRRRGRLQTCLRR